MFFIYLLNWDDCVRVCIYYSLFYISHIQAWHRMTKSILFYSTELLPKQTQYFLLYCFRLKAFKWLLLWQIYMITPKTLEKCHNNSRVVVNFCTVCGLDDHLNKFCHKLTSSKAKSRKKPALRAVWSRYFLLMGILHMLTSLFDMLATFNIKWMNPTL